MAARVPVTAAAPVVAERATAVAVDAAASGVVVPVEEAGIAEEAEVRLAGRGEVEEASVEMGMEVGAAAEADVWDCPVELGADMWVTVVDSARVVAERA